MIQESEPVKYPKHLVIIPDGNGRWAQKHGVPILEGHAKGAQTTIDLLEQMERLPIGVITIWGFSTENWSRGEEAFGIMATMQHVIDRKGDDLLEKGMKFKHVGRKDRLPASLLASIEDLESKSGNNVGKTLVLALDYGGRDEIVRAVNQVVGEQVTERSFGDYLDTKGLPDPDLIIRTSGEMRSSGIYPYQGVYAEFVSSPVLFPDFDIKELTRCLNEYSKRQRRFGARLQIDTRSSLDWLKLEETSFESYLSLLAPHLLLAKSKFVDLWRNTRFYRGATSLQEDISMFEGLLQGGKKLRPALAVLGYENFRGEREYREGLLQAAIGYEVIHNSFLIHDDIEDNSALRRGKPTIHEKYRIQHAEQGGTIDHKQYGVAVALNTGSLGPFRALGVLWGIDNRQERIVQAQQWLRSVIEITLQGQRRDLTELPLEQLTEKMVYQIHHQKTAVYTVVGPLTLGAILAGASEKEFGHLNAFGVNLGIAFQIIDDHLGLYGDEGLVGKPVGSDIAEAKKTPHFYQAFKLANPQERELLKSVWGKQDITEAEINWVRELAEKLGVKDNVLQRATLLAQHAKAVIPKFTNDPIIRTLLEDLTDYVVRREI